MRTALVIPLILACGLAGPALAQPAAAPAANPVQVASNATLVANAGAANTGATQTQAKPANPDADAALAIAIRQREAQERMAQMACNAGDTSKCQAANAPTTAKTPSP